MRAAAVRMRALVLWIEETEGACFWLKVFNDLNRPPRLFRVDMFRSWDAAAQFGEVQRVLRIGGGSSGAALPRCSVRSSKGSVWITSSGVRMPSGWAHRSGRSKVCAA
jgi:hypothetical protein